MTKIHHTVSLPQYKISEPISRRRHEKENDIKACRRCKNTFRIRCTKKKTKYVN